MRSHFVRAVEEHPQLALLGAADCCEAAIPLLQQKPDLLLVDLGLPDGNGVQLIRMLKEIHPSAEAMVISVFDEEAKVIGAIRAGASGYLLKDMLKEDIGDSIIEVLQGGSPVTPSIARYILKAMAVATDVDVDVDAPGPILSKREQEVLKLIARGYNRNEIASLLQISLHTVVTHIRHIYEKLEVHSRSEAVFEAFHHGLISFDD